MIEFCARGNLRDYLRKVNQSSIHDVAVILTPHARLSINPYSLPLKQARASGSKQQAIDLPQQLGFAMQIAQGMNQLARQRIVHRDLAAYVTSSEYSEIVLMFLFVLFSRNILITAGYDCKVSDFGLARDVYEDRASDHFF